MIVLLAAAFLFWASGASIVHGCHTDDPPTFLLGFAVGIVACFLSYVGAT